MGKQRIPLILKWIPLILKWIPLILKWVPLILKWVPLILKWIPCPSHPQEILDLREGLVEAMQGLVDDNGWRVDDYTRPVPLSADGCSTLDLEELERAWRKLDPT